MSFLAKCYFKCQLSFLLIESHLIYLLLFIPSQRYIHANRSFLAIFRCQMHEIISSLDALAPTPNYLVALLLQFKLPINLGNMLVDKTLGFRNIAIVTSPKGSTAWPVFHLYKLLLGSHRLHMSCVDIVCKAMYFLGFKTVNRAAGGNFISIIGCQVIHEHFGVDILPKSFVDDNMSVMFVEDRVDFINKMIHCNLMVLPKRYFVVFRLQFLLSFHQMLIFCTDKCNFKITLLNPYQY
jgi:hypothetical protein